MRGYLDCLAALWRLRATLCEWSTLGRAVASVVPDRQVAAKGGGAAAEAVIGEGEVAVVVV